MYSLLQGEGGLGGGRKKGYSQYNHNASKPIVVQHCVLEFSSDWPALEENGILNYTSSIIWCACVIDTHFYLSTIQISKSAS